MAKESRQRKPGSRRLRESTLKFLYACDVAGTTPAELAEVYWPLAQEHDIRRLAQGRFKAAQGLEPKLTKEALQIARHDERILGAMRPYEEADEARQQWSSLRESITLAGTRMRDLEDDLRSASDEQAAQLLASGLQPIFLQYCRIPELISSLEDAALPCPSARLALEPMEACFRRLEEISKIAQAIEDPRLGVEDEQIASLRKRETRLTSEQDKCQGRAEQIWANLETIDPKIAGLTENYRLERLDPVDRCILRQAIFEMLHDEETPALVALDEALELAKSFGSSESSGFVNGILDAVYKETV